MLDRIANRYEIMNLIGQGGMADVYLARDEILNRMVAIKVLRARLSEDPVVLLRFTREASAASKLSHPNVVDIYDVGECDHLHYIVMEYIKGQTLKQLIQRRGPVSLQEALFIMTQLASGVQAAHASGIIHRDIKPQNALVKADGTIKITDFGIAVANGAVSLTHNNAVVGSAHYLAPESAQGKTPDQRVDIYSLGIVFYELLSGEVPFKGSTPAEIALRHMQDPMPRIRRLNPQLPQSVENIILKASAKDPEERYQSVSEMAYDMQHCLDPNRLNQPVLQLKTESLSVNMNEGDTAAGSRTGRVSRTSRTTSTGRQTVPSAGGRSQRQEKITKDERKRASRRPKVSAGSVIVTSLLSLLIAFGIAWLLMQMGVIRISGFMGYESLPVLVSLSESDARAQLMEAGFTGPISITTEVSDTVEKGDVIRTSVESGSIIKKSDPIELVISKGPSFLIEDYTGQYLAEVQNRMAANGVSLNYDVEYQGVADTNPGIILSQTGLVSGDRIDPEAGATIHFVVAQYPTIEISEDLIGMDVNQAKNYLNSQGIAVVLKNNYGGSTVVDVTPSVGSSYTQEGTDSVVVLYH